jgi:hypothetical protein
MSKYLVALQYWSGDKNQAMKVARLLSLMNEEPLEDVDLMFSVRSGAEPPGLLTMDLAKTKFNEVHVVLGKRRETGWPGGCNALWHETMMEVYRKVRDNVQRWKAVLTLEPDVVVLDRDWAKKLFEAWEVAHARGKPILGHIIKDHPCPHTNGNAIFPTDLMQRVPDAYGTPSAEAWDTYWSKQFLPMTEDCPMMISKWNCESIDREELYKPREEGIKPVFFHGVKDNSAIKIVLEDKLSDAGATNYITV